MKSLHWRDVADLVGVAAIVASLIFVGLQLKQDSKLGRADITSARTESAVALTQLVTENSELWIKGLDGEELSIVDEMTFFAIAETIETYLFEEWSNLNQIGDEEFADAVLKDYAYQIYAYPGLRRIWEEDGERLRDQKSTNSGNAFRTAVDEELENLRSRRPAKPEKPNYVYW
jgi:hypothetical protein